MDLQAILAEVATWPAASRMQLAEQIWDELVDDGIEPELTADVRNLIETRLARHEVAPDAVLTWDEIVAHVRRPQ